MPLLTQELALGQRFQGGDIEAFGKMNARLRGIGLASVVGAYLIGTSGSSSLDSLLLQCHHRLVSLLLLEKL